jgi:hypothetical protein
MKNYVKTFEQFVAGKLEKIYEADLPIKPTGDSIKTSDDALKALIKDPEIKTFKFIKDTPYEKVIETKKAIAPAVTFPERGGDLNYAGTNINIDDTNFVKDSQEIEKKFQWIKNRLEKITPNEFESKFKAVQEEYTKRFKDSELTITDDNIEYSHKFVQNDNIAQRDYTTADGKTIKKGDKIPQNAKVLHFLVGKVSKPTEEPAQQETFIQLASKTITIKVPTLKEPMQATLAKIKELQEAGFPVSGSGNLRIINKTPMWIKKQDYMNAINLINNDIHDTFVLNDGKRIDGFMAPADPELSKQYFANKGQ